MVVPVVPILIAAAETLAEVKIVVGWVYVIAGITVVSVLVRVRVLVAKGPVILPVRLSGAKAFLVPIVHGFPKEIRAISIRLVVAAATEVPIARCGVEIRVTDVVIVARILHADLLLSQPHHILQLELILVRPALLLQLRGPLLCQMLLLIEMLAVLHAPLLLLSNPFLLLLV